eukprot:CAMPEP_0117827038 /NCGR_PEP_ID=MMETSP0949-20121206/6469_1 /TAXON_ID=44440 /ORGANISM="Chattonella subsalsa, Strain CCMP2191" /LENGTH=254 /DNA_ID=CAMNT_0005667395 /DNA_START=16 /DNA_END=780 /DNA_ORIENTATION=-
MVLLFQMDLLADESGRKNDDGPENISNFRRCGSELSLAFHSIHEIPASVAEREGPLVKTLNLTECELRSYSNLEHFSSLETLVLDKNNLEGLQNCPVLTSLTTLWFNNNEVSDLPTFMDDCIQCFPNLTYLSMMRNPACPGLMDLVAPDLEACRLYRLYVLFRAPQLTTLDSTSVTNKEREEAQLRGQYAVRRRLATTQSGKAVPSPVSNTVISEAATPSGHTRDASQPRLKYAKSRYDGRHSEGNRFIRDTDL